MEASDPGALKELAARLRLFQMERRFTVEALQRRAGLGHTTVSQALNGRKMPSEATVIALARALGVDAGELLALRARGAGPRLSAEDVAFEQRYRDYIVERHSSLTVVGLDLSRPEAACWPLDTAYLSLELASEAERGLPAPATTVERAEQALAGRRRVLIRGQAGSGKTTLLQWLAVTSGPDLVPFVLPLRTLVRHGGALPIPQYFLAATGCALASMQPKDWEDRLLSAGRGLLLVDGLDEVPKQQREHTRAWLRELIAAYPQARFLVTTRPSAVPERWLSGQEFTECTVRPMSRRDVLVFVQRWHRAAGASMELEESLKDVVRGQRDLSQLATTPLMCALVCALHRDRRGHLPRGRMELYEAALSMLLIRRDDEREVKAPEGIVLDRHQAVQLLQRLAYWLIRNGQAEMEEETALSVIEDALPAMPTVAAQGDAQQVLGHLVSRSGLLRRPSADTIDFIHRTFQDYLGAKAAVESRDLGLLVRNAHDEQWEDVLRMAVAHARPAERGTLLRRLVARGDRTLKHRTRLHLVAMACLEQATELDPEVRATVEERTAAMLPPRTYDEATRLASVGPVILDLLPGPEGLLKDELVPVISIATELGGDAAMTFLKRFRTCDDPDVQSVLALEWRAFDTHDYTQDIIRHLSPGTRIAVRNRAELETIPSLPQQSDFYFSGNFSEEELLSVLNQHELQGLDICNNTALLDLDFVGMFGELRRIGLSGLPHVLTLSPLRGLPLTDLTLALAQPMELEILEALPTLKRADIDAPMTYRSMASLLRLPSLRELYLWQRPFTTTTLSGISSATRLEFLSFPASDVPEASRGELAEMPALTCLQINSQYVRLLMDSPPLPHVSHLILNAPLGHGDLTPVKTAFPGLRLLTLMAGAVENRVNLSGLAGIDGLKVKVVDAQMVFGLDHFPPGAVTLTPRPRT
ncbi:NACHT domain-containing protein [Streptomyces sp. NPDC001262]|uniref:NACHT domain-containing protein n=1 Tax=Streptomyces sp. NPDC001262 TaxID=3364552 RepID=UPI0036A09357